jgi:acetyl-CoA carboxylase carboxyl transferase subunit alpha
VTRTVIESVRIARHQDRPYASDVLARLLDNFREMHGDRRFGDDSAIICGFGEFRGLQVALIGQQKGRDTAQRRYRNFAMSKPEGYRKALRTMQLAEKFGRPVISLIDTPGAYPGIDAEERGQAEAIATNLKVMSRLSVPVVSLVLGEGGSGGALAIGVGDVLLMLENSIYSVISPEGCAAILWKNAEEAPRAAEGLKLTAGDLLGLGVADEVIPEPSAGAHTDWDEAIGVTGQILLKWVERSKNMMSEERVNRRYAKLRLLGM